MNFRLFALGLLAIPVALATFLVPDARGFKEPALARMIFWHVPCALLSSLFVLVAAYYAVRYLNSPKMKWDIRVGAALELGALSAGLAMATGILFSRVQWGAWWHNDPRQTSFLIVLLTMLAGLALRGALSDEIKRASSTAVYCVASVIPLIFFTFVFPRLPQIAGNSLHPSQTIAQGQLDTNYRVVLYATFFLLFLCFVALFRRRVKVGEMELTLENLNELDTDRRRDPTDPGVVRPVSLPKGH